MELQLNDLRLDNLAQDQEGNLLSVYSISKDRGVMYKVLDRNKYPLPDGWKAEPIPLTEEWLLKFDLNNGFFPLLQNRDTSGTMKQLEIEFNGIGDISLWIVDDEADLSLYHNIEHQVKYVHQLQNLYFSLTGQELKYA